MRREEILNIEEIHKIKKRNDRTEQKFKIAKSIRDKRSGGKLAKYTSLMTSHKHVCPNILFKMKDLPPLQSINDTLKDSDMNWSGMFSGGSFFSALLPDFVQGGAPENFYFCRGKILIMNRILISGTIGLEELNFSTNEEGKSLTREIYDSYGAETYYKFMENLSIVVCHYFKFKNENISCSGKNGNRCECDFRLMPSS